MRNVWDPVLTNDEKSLIVSADRILSGDVPHRDSLCRMDRWAITSWPPLSLSSEPVSKGSGLLALVLHMAVCAGVFWLALSRGTVLALAASVATAVLLQPLGLVAYPWLGGLIFTLGAVSLLQAGVGPKGQVWRARSSPEWGCGDPRFSSSLWLHWRSPSRQSSSSRAMAELRPWIRPRLGHR